MQIRHTPIAGLEIIQLNLHGDDRGWFKENWNQRDFAVFTDASWQLQTFRPVQHNLSFNATAGVTRGMHAEPWNKLISIAYGEVMAAWIDLRSDSPTYGTKFQLRIGPDQAVFVPRGVANGFQALTATTYSYLVDAHWSADAQYFYASYQEISWPLPVTELSAADRTHPPLAQAQPVPPLRVLITGATGQVGQALRKYFPNAEFSTRADLDLTADLTADLASDLKHARDWTQYSAIIHAAAYTAVDQAQNDAQTCWQVNAHAVTQLATIARDYNLVFVNLSSDYVFDGTKDTAYVETDRVAPLNVYGQSKAAGEIATSIAHNHYNIRTSWVIGEGANFVATMRRFAAEGRSPQVITDQIGRLTFADDLARGIAHLLQTHAPFGTYHLTSSGPKTSWYEIAQEVYRLSHADPALVQPITAAEYGAQAPRPHNSVLNTAKLEATGFQPADWRTQLAAYLHTSTP
ncbi:dTDP-4-dehydrorhamnose reductase [Corynebacterium sp. HS2168-gen11]|uniref:dTDP-4-dehydrorhamnose reductase n=1 Tax=Corynebacterium sp. HS2168-gen11 TaxID=2974027 RepID=UPI00216AEC5E|nr:dTDP-4-dehydrorhamnose reductase [Corynebacterium sp. HS2168-gen11]MCS4535604.1 dTDP-4-dehydrorhamnose reductase [Corynebacterium sp. HS2168-gen11]